MDAYLEFSTTSPDDWHTASRRAAQVSSACLTGNAIGTRGNVAEAARWLDVLPQIRWV